MAPTAVVNEHKRHGYSLCVRAERANLPGIRVRVPDACVAGLSEPHLGLVLVDIAALPMFAPMRPICAVTDKNVMISAKVHTEADTATHHKAVNGGNAMSQRYIRRCCG